MSCQSSSSEEAMVLTWPVNPLNLARADRPGSKLRFGCLVLYYLARRRLTMITLAVLVVLSGPLLTWGLQGVPIPDGGRLAVEWISPAVLCGILLKLLFDERADARAERQRHEEERTKRDAEHQAILLKVSSALDRHSDKIEAMHAGSFCLYADDKHRHPSRHGD